MSVPGLGLPGRHEAGSGHRGDLFGTLRGIVISEKRKRRHFARTMAAAAIVVEDGRDVVVKVGGRVLVAFGGEGGQHGHAERHREAGGQNRNSHQFTPGIEQPKTLVTGFLTGCPAITWSNASRRSSCDGLKRVLPISTNRSSTRPRYSTSPPGDRITASGVDRAPVSEASKWCGSSSAA